MGSVAESLESNERTALLVAQNEKYLGQIAEMPLAQPEAVLRLRAIYWASDRETAEKLAKKLLNDWKETGYYQAAECLWVALPRLLTYYEFPAEHHRHLRTTTVIESPFATVRLRTDAAKRFRSARSGTHLVFKVLESCEKRWSRISHPEKLKEVKLPKKEN